MNKENITKKILDKIEDQKIVPKPKWHFLFKDYIVWILAILSIVVGAVGFSATIFSLSHAGWDLYRVTHTNIIIFTASVFPYLWVLLMLVFVSVSYYNFKHTKRGYKFKLSTLIFGTVLSTVILGLIFNITGFGQIADRKFGHTESRIFEMWSQSENGLLAGEIQNISEEYFILKDFEGKEWRVHYDELDKTQSYLIRENMKLRIVGESEGESGFSACFIAPLDLPYNLQRQISPRHKDVHLPKPIIKKVIERNEDQERSNKCESVRSYIRNQKPPINN